MLASLNPSGCKGFPIFNTHSTAPPSWELRSRRARRLLPPTPGIHHDKATFYIRDTQRLVRGIAKRIDGGRSA